MLNKIKNRIERELISFVSHVDKAYCLNQISPILFKAIKDFILRNGKRIRPILFCIGYLGFKKRPSPGLYKTALSLELLHDFMLVHDDIIDKSSMRRGKPSMHILLKKYIKNPGRVKVKGEDLAIIAGDVMYAMAIGLFLSIKEDFRRKEKALKKFIEAAVYTGGGEFIEILYGIKDLAKLNKDYIYKIYDYKTAYYSFAYPLASGAILAGADEREVKKLLKLGICLGRGFQIKDDILGMFASEGKIGKSILSDLQEAKRTILIWHAYDNASMEQKNIIKKLFNKKMVNKSDLLKIRKIVRDTGALGLAMKEVRRLLSKTKGIIASSKIHTKYASLLKAFSHNTLHLE